MGDLTLEQFRTELAASVQRTEAELSNTRMDYWLHWGMRYFAYAFRFRELEGAVNFSTVDGTFEYDIGTDIVVTDFRAVDGEYGLRKTAPDDRLGKVIPETRDEFLLRAGDLTDSTARAEPTHYHRYANDIVLRPVPDSTVVTVQMHYLKTATLTAGNPAPFEPQWDNIILTGGIAWAHRGLGEHDRYQNIFNDYIGMVRMLALEEDLEEFPEGGISLAQNEADLTTR